MTRINVIEPADLTDQHLIAEYRELPRVFALARDAIDRAWRDDCTFASNAAAVRVDCPRRYTLGTGHVRFFYPRTGYLAKRQAAIIAECQSRGFAIAHTTPPAPVPGLDDDWIPDAAARAVNLARLRDKLATAKRPYTYGGLPVSLDFYPAT